MQALGMDYRALRDITVNGVAMARAGDLVHAVHVTGDDPWLQLGVDVEPVAGADVPPPARNASAAAWEAYLTATTDLDPAELAAMGRDAMVAAYDKLTGPAEPGPAAPASPRPGRSRTAAAGQGDDANDGSTS